ncbi:MAG: PLP-dependent aminotransferase family protein [Gammaproteobacteria bacterium]|nr:PLP-dependent aminotransferase family protein [Gammaproteobacteria bacterium]MCG3146332.1 HTH-type transcriptional regulatory protein GabR [Gammaproteobacteria bacterium]
MQLPIVLCPTARQPLQRQLFDQIRELVLSGRLKPGTLLPASRALADQLGVSRNTVLLTYEQLLAEGYLQTRQAVGTYVSLELPEECLGARRAQAEPAAEAGAHACPHPLPFQGRSQALVNPLRLAYDFWLGRPDPHSFPIKAWHRLVNRALASAGTRFTEYREPAGLFELREAIVDHLGPARGICASPDQVVIVAGSQGGLNLISRLLVREDTRVATENPCYQGAAFLFESHRAELLPVPVDEDGIVVDLLPRSGAQLLYVTPSHQYPMGFMMSLERRLRLLEWARRSGAYIIEDDYDSDFRYRGSPLTALQGLDRHDSVIYLGTFSKSMGAGLRLGYLVLPRQLVEPARTAKALLDNGHPWLDQAVMAEYIASGAYDAHLRRIRQIYRERRDCLLERLQHHFGDVVVTGQDGGMHIAWHLPRWFPQARELQAMVEAQGVGIYSLQSGAAHDFGGCAYSEGTVVLGFSSLEEKRIRAGIDRVAEVIARHRGAPAHRAAADSAHPPLATNLTL